MTQLSYIQNLIQSGDIDTLRLQMSDRSAEVNQALKEYTLSTHQIMYRPEKLIKNSSGEVVKVESQWRLPIPYQKFINEIALVFLYGQPVKFTQLSQGTDEAFKSFLKLKKSLRFDSRIREAKRLAGAETESALLLHVFRNEENKPDALLKVLAASKGDSIHTAFDEYGRLVAFGHGYYVKGNYFSLGHGSNQIVQCFDLFMKNNIYRCTQNKSGWNVEIENNILGKIPVIYFSQEPEHEGVQQLIEREEHIVSTTADVNDYFASPAVVITADVLKNLPEKGEPGKLFVKDSKEGDVSYLTVDSSPDLKRMEVDYLERQILSKSFTPNIDFETMRSLGNVSGKTLKQLLVLAEMKANNHKELHGEMIDRMVNLMVTVIGRVFDIRLESECKVLKIGHTFQSPFKDDLSEAIANLIHSVDAGMISEQTARELHPLITNPLAETIRIEHERESRRIAENPNLE